MRSILGVALFAILAAAFVPGCRRAAQKPAENNESANASSGNHEGGEELQVLHKGGRRINPDLDEPGKVTITDEQGNSSTYEAGVVITEEDVGIPFYHGAEFSNGIRSNSAGYGRAVQAILESRDDFDSIKTFYKSIVPDDAVHSETDGRQARNIMFAWTRGDDRFSINIIEEKETNKISIVLNKLQPDQ